MPEPLLNPERAEPDPSRAWDQLLARLAFLESEVRALERTVTAFETHPFVRFAVQLQNRAAAIFRALRWRPRPNPYPELLVLSRHSARRARSATAPVEIVRLPAADRLTVEQAGNLPSSRVEAGRSPYVLFLPPNYDADLDALWALIDDVPEEAAVRPDVIYFDEILDNGLLLRPAWSPALAGSDDYPGPILVKRSVLRELSPVQQTRFTSTGQLAQALDHLGVEPKHWPRPVGRRRGPTGLRADHPAKADPADTFPQTAKSCTVIVCSRNPQRVRRFLGSLEKTAGPLVLQILLVAHQAYGQRRSFAPNHSRLTQIDYEGPFNFSRMNNLAAEQAQGDVLLFLNDDVIATKNGWLEELLSHLRRPDVGLVGALLRYPDGRIQHAGVTLARGGSPGHAGRLSRQAPSYWPWLTRTHDVLAVTGACLAIGRQQFTEVGRFDEALPVNYNDVDLCLRVRRQGKRVICVAADGLLHEESQTRRGGVTSDERWRFFERWPDAAETDDPFYHPLLAPGEIIALRDPATWLLAGLDAARFR